MGIVGTFDVKNYGDLLFPLMAAEALSRRNQSVQVLPFAPNSRSESSWPFRVHSTADFPELLPSLSAVLIGGGQLIRFDKGYPVSVDPNVDVPLAYWLIPAALGALAGKPVLWNATGAWTDSPSAPWYNDVVRTVLSASHFVGVRDAASRSHLAQTVAAADIQLLPDTVFSISRFWPLEQESADYIDWRKSLGIQGSYVVLQAQHEIANYRSALEPLLRKMGMATTVILPICWCHGDRTEGFPRLSADVTASPDWLPPRLISEILGRSDLVIASSLHACITSLSYGVPAVRVPSYHSRDRKFELLDEFEGVATIDDADALTALLHRGRKTEPRVVECADRLDCYWDTVMEVARKPDLYDPKRSMALMLRWASTIFGDIEAAALADIQHEGEAGARKTG